MLNELKKYIKGNFSDDYWYDEALFLCEDFLKHFSDSEWTAIISEIQNYDIQSQLRLAECLTYINNRYSVEILLKLTQTENKSLLITCIDSLRDADFSLLTVEEKHSVLINARKVLINCSEPEKKVINNFLDKILFKGDYDNGN